MQLRKTQRSVKVTYSVEFGGTPQIPSGTYQLALGSDGQYRYCVFENCLSFFIRDNSHVLTDGFYEWTIHNLHWNDQKDNRLTLSTEPSTDHPYEVMVRQASDYAWPKAPPPLLGRTVVVGAGGNQSNNSSSSSSSSSDSCTGWYCCQEKSEVIYFENCQQKNSYVCASSSSSGDVTVLCCSNPLPTTLYTTFSVLAGCDFSGAVIALMWTGTAWVATGLLYECLDAITLTCTDGTWTLIFSYQGTPLTRTCHGECTLNTNCGPPFSASLGPWNFLSGCDLCEPMSITIAP